MKKNPYNLTPIICILYPTSMCNFLAKVFILLHPVKNSYFIISWWQSEIRSLKVI